jgi:uncharacterized membrane protein
MPNSIPEPNANRHERNRQPSIAKVAGAALLVAGLVGVARSRHVRGSRRRDDTRRALSGDRGIRLEESITIDSTPEDLYDRWRRLVDLPRYIPHLESVEVLDARRSHWVARGPANLKVRWDAEIINDIDPHVIAWRSLPGADVASAGAVRFVRQVRGGTTVTVTLQYDPPAGKLGGWIAWLAGTSPETELRQGLRSFKRLVETGEIPTVEGQPHGRRGPFSRLAGVSS